MTPLGLVKWRNRSWHRHLARVSRVHGLEARATIAQQRDGPAKLWRMSSCVKVDPFFVTASAWYDATDLSVAGLIFILHPSRFQPCHPLLKLSELRGDMARPLRSIR